MRYARIIDGVVVNVELWGEQPSADGVVFVALADDSPVGIGYTYAGGVFAEPVVEPSGPVVPEFVTKGQLIRAFYTLHGVTVEVLDGTIAAIIEAAPEEMGDKTELAYQWQYSNTVYRANPLVVVVGMAFGLDAVAIDAVFVYATRI